MGIILVLRIFKTIIGLLGVLGNALVCVVIYRVPFMHTLTNALIFNQAAIDLFGSVVLLLESNVPVPERLSDTPAGWLLCRVWVGNLFLWGTFNASTLNLLSVTLDRLFAIVFPLRYSRFFTRRLVVLMIVGSWCLGIAEQGVYIAVVQTFTEGRCDFESSSGSRLFGVLYICIAFFAPSLAMLAAYITIIRVLKKCARRVAPGGVGPAASQPPPAGSGAENTAAAPQVETRGGSLLRASRNTFKTLLVVFITFLVCWTPNQITFLLFNLDLGWSIEFSKLTVILVAANSCVNPVIYGLKYKRFRQGVRKLLGYVVTDEFSLSVNHT